MTLIDFIMDQAGVSAAHQFPDRGGHCRYTWLRHDQLLDDPE
jgi:hypothetical protein